MAGARQIVDGPSFAVLPHGLWDAVEQRTTTTVADSHWQSGVTWMDSCPGSGFLVYDECVAVTGTGGGPPAMPTFQTAGNVVNTNRGATSFTVLTEFDCSPVGRLTGEIQHLAEEALARVEAREAERAFWTGQAGSAGGGAGQNTVWPCLANGSQVFDSLGITLQPVTTQVVTGTGVDVADGLGQLEKALSDCYGGAQGLIHVSPTLLPTLQAWGLVRNDTDGQLVTTRGNRVVVGSGYPGTSPTGQAPAAGQSWVYATGAMFGYRSDVVVHQMAETFDRAKNTVRAQAYRTYLFGYECCLLAAQIATGVPVSPSA